MNSLSLLNNKSLLKNIYETKDPTIFVQSLPAPTVYFLLASEGLETSKDLLEYLSPEQYQLLLDFDFWTTTEFNEENFWRWLMIIDEKDTLEPLAKFLQNVDRNLLGTIIIKYTNTVVQEEPTDLPPHSGYHTPDKGFTWVAMNIDDKQRYFLLGKLLAFIFETDAEFYYQLINSHSSATPTELEEYAFEEKTKRLLANGFPDADLCGEIHKQTTAEEIIAVRKKIKTDKKITLESIPTFTPEIINSNLLQPLSNFVNELASKSDEHKKSFEEHLAYTLTAASTYFAVPLYEIEELSFLIAQIKGAYNIGLQSVKANEELTAIEIYETVGPLLLYQRGLDEIFNIRKIARKLQKQAKNFNSVELTVIEAASSKFPYSFEFVFQEEQFATKLNQSKQALERLSDCELLSKYLNKLNQ